MTASPQGSSQQPTVTSDNGETPKPRYDWTDPSVPVGNAPPMPRWRLYLLGGLWAGWVVFLFAMAVAAHRPS